MSQSVSIWAHCITCKTLARELNGVPLLVTSCGRLVCQNCCPRSRDTTCPTCVGGCNTVQLNSKAPSNIQNLLKDVSSQMKAIVKILSWQESQKKSIVEHRMKEARMLQEKERLQQEEISKLDQQLDQRRRKLCKMEEMEAQLKAQLKSLTRREGGSGSGGGGGSRDRHQFGHQSPNSSLLHSGQHHGQLHGQHQGQHHGQQWIGNNLPGGRSPGGPLSSAFYKGMSSHSPANSFLGGLDSSRRSAGSGGSRRSGERAGGHFANKPSNSAFLQMATPAAWYKKPGFQR